MDGRQRPEQRQGFESAVAYAVAEQLGFPADKVTWTRVGFDEAIAKPGASTSTSTSSPSPTTARSVVDFSSGYYTVAQTVITVDGSPISGATSLAELKDAKLGAMNGTTSLQAITATIDPATPPQVFDDNSLAAQALQNGQVDGLVVDLPTAFYMTGAQLDNGKVIGQLKAPSGDAEQLGLLLAKDSALTACVTSAVDALRDDGTLATLETEWLAGSSAAPVATADRQAGRRRDGRAGQGQLAAISHRSCSARHSAGVAADGRPRWRRLDGGGPRRARAAAGERTRLAAVAQHLLRCGLRLGGVARDRRRSLAEPAADGGLRDPHPDPGAGRGADQIAARAGVLPAARGGNRLRRTSSAGCR